MKTRPQSGFALLLVFLMAAVIAITLYLELPRVAFESQRQKEQLLIERGEQYKRAIQVFYNNNKRWPAKIEDLENFNNRRFLRKRYIDPMTGKDEWRVIHIQNGILTDSILNKNKKDPNNNQATTTGQFVGELAAVGQTPLGGGAGVGGAAMANRRRASDGAAPGVDNSGGQPDPAAGAQPGAPPYPAYQGSMTQGLAMQGQQYPQPGAAPGYPGAVNPGVPQPGMPSIPGMPVMPGQVPGQVTPQQIIQGRMNPAMPGMQPASQPQTSGSGGSSYIGGGAYIGGSVPTAQPAYPTPSSPYQQPQQYPGVPGAPVSSQTGGVSPQPFQPYVPYGTIGGSQGQTPAYPAPQGQPGSLINPPTGAVAAALGNAIYGPRPGGPPQVGALGQAMGAGIAGFASKAEADAIMVYHDHSNYSEWEFVYDPTKQKPLLNPLSAPSGATPVSSLASSTTSSAGSPFGISGGSGPRYDTGLPFGTPPSQPAPAAIPQNIQPGYSPLLTNDGSTVRPPVNAPSGNPPNSGYGVNPIKQ